MFTFCAWVKKIKFSRQFKQKLKSIDNDVEDTVSYDLWNIYHFDPQLSAPLTGDEIITNLNLVLVVSKILYKL